MSIVYKSMLEVFFVLVLLELIWLKINPPYIKNLLLYISLYYWISLFCITHIYVFTPRSHPGSTIVSTVVSQIWWFEASKPRKQSFCPDVSKELCWEDLRMPFKFVKCYQGWRLSSWQSYQPYLAISEQQVIHMFINIPWILQNIVMCIS